LPTCRCKQVRKIWYGRSSSTTLQQAQSLNDEVDTDDDDDDDDDDVERLK
jgi:hypothetical protein